MGIPTFVIVLLVHLGCCCCCLVRTTVSVVRQGSTRHGNTHLCHCTVGTSGLLLLLSCTYHGQCFKTGFFLSDMGILTFVIAGSAVGKSGMLLLPAVLLVSLRCCCCSLLYHGQCCKAELYPTWEYPHLALPAVLLVSLGCCCCILLYHGQCCKTELYPTWEYPHLALPAVLLVSLGCCCCSLLYHGQCCKTELYPTWEYPHLALPAVLLVSLGCCCSLITKLVYLGLGWLSFLTASCCVLYDGPKRIISTIVWSAK